MRIHCQLALALPLIGLVASSAPAQAPVWKGKIVQENGLPVVMNPKEPLFVSPAPTFRPDWQIGGPGASADESPLLFAQIAISKSGQVLIPDVKSCDIKIFDGNGRFLRRFGRKGQGPGEFTVLGGIALDESKGELLALDFMKVSIFKLDGTFVRSQATRERWNDAAIDSEGRVLAAVSFRDGGLVRRVLKGFDAALKSEAVIHEWTSEDERSYNPFLPPGAWGIDGRGNVYCGDSTTYAIEVYDSSHRPVREIRKDDDPVRIPADIREKARKTVPPGLRSDIPEFYPAFRRILVDEKGFLLVQTSRREGGEIIYDLFDDRGRYLAPIAVPFFPLAYRDEKLYSREQDAEGFLLAKRYALNWNR